MRCIDEVLKRARFPGLALVLAVLSPACPSLAVEPQSMSWELPPIKEPSMQARAERLYKITERLAHHLVGELHSWDGDPDFLLLTASKSNEHSIRPNAGTLAGLAFLCRFGPYDERVTGISRPDLLKTKVLPMMRYLVATHVTGSRPTSDGKKWGDAWQSAHWTATLGTAAWWLGDDLPPGMHEEVCRVVAHEADRFVEETPPHQLKADTKAEENAWNSQVLSVAVVLMPRDPRRQEWERAFQKWALSSWLRPADERSSTKVDGRPLAEQFTGANIYDDFTLENHRIVHPDYMTAWSLTLGCSMEHLLTGRKPPQAVQHNMAGIYENLKWFRLPDGGFVYPSGQDWALFRQVDWLYPNLLAAVFTRDAEAWSWADQLLDLAGRMQARSESGAIYLPEENFFASASTDRLYQFARAWICLHFAQSVKPKETECRGVRRLEAANIILNRTPTAVHALCWGTKIMGQCVPMQTDRLISPDTRSGVGHVRLKGEKLPLPVSLEDARIVNDDDTFRARLVVNHGDVIQAQLTFGSHSDGSWTASEKLVALRDVETAEIATGLIGILNDQNWVYERGERHVLLDSDMHRVPSCSGTVLRGEDVRRVAIDSVLQITGDTPLRVRYKAAKEYQRSRVTDELTLNCLDTGRSWKAGQTISQWRATTRCEPGGGSRLPEGRPK